MTYQLLLTTLGQQKLSAAASAGAQPVRITEFAVGQGVNVDFSKRLDQQVLVSKRYQGKVESVVATAVVGQYEITCIVPQNQGGWAIREIGLIDSEGSLIWVGQVPEVQKPVASSTAAVDYRIKAVISIDNPDVNLVIDANVVTATQAWVNKNFVTKPEFQEHLDAGDPHPQYLLEKDFSPFDDSVLDDYVLKTTYDAHVLKYQELVTDYREHVETNRVEHLALQKWQSDHIAHENPHTQYLLRGELDEIIRNLEYKIEQGSGGGSNGEFEIIALIDVHVSARTVLGETVGSIQVKEERGLPITFTPDSLDINSPMSWNSHYITFNLPTVYDPNVHRILATGNASYVINKEAKTITFRIISHYELYEKNNGGDEGYSTEDRLTLAASMRIEITRWR